MKFFKILDKKSSSTSGAALSDGFVCKKVP